MDMIIISDSDDEDLVAASPSSISINFDLNGVHHRTQKESPLLVSPINRNKSIDSPASSSSEQTRSQTAPVAWPPRLSIPETPMSEMATMDTFVSAPATNVTEWMTNGGVDGAAGGPFTATHLGTLCAGAQSTPKAHDTVRSSILVRQDFKKFDALTGQLVGADERRLLEEAVAEEGQVGDALNPDQMKRYELYSYLKLTTMNEVKGSDAETLPQQRRSSRIKHLSYGKRRESAKGAGANKATTTTATAKKKHKYIYVTLPKEKTHLALGDGGGARKSLTELGIDVTKLINDNKRVFFNSSFKDLPVLHLNKLQFLKASTGANFKLKAVHKVNADEMTHVALPANGQLNKGEDAELRRSINRNMLRLSAMRKKDAFSPEHKKCMTAIQRNLTKRRGGNAAKMTSCRMSGFQGFDRAHFAGLRAFRRLFRDFAERLQSQYRRYVESKAQEAANANGTLSPSWLDDDCIIVDEDNVEESIIVDEDDEEEEREFEGSDMDVEDEVILDEDDEEVETVDVDFSSDSTDYVGQPEIVNVATISSASTDYIEVNKNANEVKSLRQHLMSPRKLIPRYKLDEHDSSSWLKVDDRRTSSHVVQYVRDSGDVLNLCYFDFNLIIVQENLVTFWTQSALGNIMGSQKKWIPRGGVQRLILGNGCVRKPTQGMVMSDNHNSVVYIELWTKEHVFDKRERPVTDIFITLYIRLNRSTEPHKKVLQLENINGYSRDVQYVVVRNSRNIIVSWSSTVGDEVVSYIHCYILPEDFQKVCNIRKMESPGHRICSLHTIEDCDDLVMGCGDYRISLWNFELGHLVVTIDLSEVRPEARILWTKNDRGFLFAVRQCEDGNLDLVAINSYDNSWKRLRTYKPNFEDNTKILLGVCLENGLLIGFYEDIVVIWNADSSLILNKYSFEDSLIFICGNYVCVAVEGHVFVSHHLQYLIVSSNDT